MAPWITPRLHATGDTFAVTDWNAVAGNTTFLYQTPYIATGGTNTTLVNGVTTLIGLGAGTTTGGGFTLPSGIWAAPPFAGIYAVIGCITVIPSPISTMQLYAEIKQNGVLALEAGAAGYPIGVMTSGVLACAAGDLLTLSGLQGSGSNQSIVTGGTSTYLHSYLVGSQ